MDYGGSATEKTYNDNGGEARLVIVEQLGNFRKNQSHMAIQTYVEYLEGTANPKRYHYQLNNARWYNHDKYVY